MKHCLLCKNQGKHCICEHCEDFESFQISDEGQLLLKQYSVDLQNKIEQQRAEIERLKRYEMSESEFQKYCAYKIIEPQIRGCLDRERELQKQVDELKKSQVTHIHIDDQSKKECEYELQQAVKDTAKEILQELYNETIRDGIPAVYCTLTPKEIKDRAKRYGVEVE